MLFDGGEWIRRDRRVGELRAVVFRRATLINLNNLKCQFIWQRRLRLDKRPFSCNFVCKLSEGVDYTD